MTGAFAVLAWATLGAVYLEACMSLADRFHWWRIKRRGGVADLKRVNHLVRSGVAFEDRQRGARARADGDA